MKAMEKRTYTGYRGSAPVGVWGVPRNLFSSPSPSDRERGPGSEGSPIVKEAR